MPKKSRPTSKQSPQFPFQPDYEHTSSTKTHQKRWTPEEDSDFLAALYQCGYGKWTQIASLLGDRTPLQVKNRARHLILYETGTKLSDVLRAMASNSNSLDFKNPPRAISSVAVRRSTSRVINYAEESQDEEDFHSRIEKTESLFENTAFDSDKENFSDNLQFSQIENGLPPYHGDSDSVLSVNPSLLLSPSLPLSSGSSTMRPILPPCPLQPIRTQILKIETNGEECDDREELGVDARLASIINSPIISEKEMTALPEFFQGLSLTRTPERYLKIRSTILTLWNSKKPQYVTKLSARVALRGIAGDVSLISKVHAYLERANLINYSMESVKFDKKPNRKIKNLLKRMSNSVNSDKNHQVKKTSRITRLPPLPDIPNSISSIPRSSSSSNGFSNNSSQGEFRRRPRTRALGLDPFELQKLTTTSPFKIEFTPLVFTLIHIHAFLSPSQEIIGVLGGHVHPTEPNRIIVTQIYPCKSQVMSLTECEMDPFSELQACEFFSKKGCSMIGWYHSHPTFPSNPSRRDLETQALYQKLYEWSSPEVSSNGIESCSHIHSSKPTHCSGGFVGVIISPRKDGIEMTCFQSTLYANSLVMGQSVSWKINTTHKTADIHTSSSHDNQGTFVDEEWANAINELFVVEGSKGMSEAECKRLLHYLITHLPILATHHSFLCTLLLPARPSNNTDIIHGNNKT
jgi:histone H2A deubiquitinase